MRKNMPTPGAAVDLAPQGTTRSVRSIGMLTMLAIFVQFILAGLGTFDTAHAGVFKDSYFTVHDRFALVIVFLAVLMVVVALVTRSGRMVVGKSILLTVLVAPVQHALATVGTDHAPWLGSLHVLTGVLILILDADITFPHLVSRLRTAPPSGSR